MSKFQVNISYYVSVCILACVHWHCWLGGRPGILSKSYFC